MLLAVIMLLGVGYAVVSSQTLTSNATFTIGERAANVVIMDGYIYKTDGFPISSGVVSEKGLSITFSETLSAEEAEKNLLTSEVYLNFKNNEPDFSVEIRVESCILKLDGEVVDNSLYTFVDDGFYYEIYNENYYSYVLNPNDTKYYDLYIYINEEVAIDLYESFSIELTFKAVITDKINEFE